MAKDDATTEKLIDYVQSTPDYRIAYAYAVWPADNTRPAQYGYIRSYNMAGERITQKSMYYWENNRWYSESGYSAREGGNQIQREEHGEGLVLFTDEESFRNHYPFLGLFPDSIGEARYQYTDSTPVNIAHKSNRLIAYEHIKPVLEAAKASPHSGTFNLKRVLLTPAFQEMLIEILMLEGGRIKLELEPEVLASLQSLILERQEHQLMEIKGEKELEELKQKLACVSKKNEKLMEFKWRAHKNNIDQCAEIESLKKQIQCLNGEVAKLNKALVEAKNKSALTFAWKREVFTETIKNTSIESSTCFKDLGPDNQKILKEYFSENFSCTDLDEIFKRNVLQLQQKMGKSDLDYYLNRPEILLNKIREGSWAGIGEMLPDLFDAFTLSLLKRQEVDDYFESTELAEPTDKETLMYTSSGKKRRTH